MLTVVYGVEVFVWSLLALYCAQGEEIARLVWDVRAALEVPAHSSRQSERRVAPARSVFLQACLIGVALISGGMIPVCLIAWEP